MKIIYGLACYLFGALPTGYLAFRLSEKRDIRHYGSQSTGATNVLRLKGLTLALPVILIDLSKGFLPVVLGQAWFPRDPAVPLAGALLAVAGHCWPVTIRFRGGKGVAVSLGAFAGLSFLPFLFCLAVFAAVTVLTRYVSLGSLSAVLLYPLFRLAWGESEILAWGWWAILFILVALRHKSNIQRLLAGKENRLGQKAEAAGG